MAHYAKYTRASVGGLTKHYERAKGKDGEYLRFKNEQIDPSRTYMNYNLAPHQKDQRDFIKERLEDVFCLKRDNVKVMCDWVVTVPKTVPEDYHREFFERAYQLLAEKHGEKNVVSAHVHMDETTPHMHFAFVPVVFDAKKNREKVSAKEAVTREDLRTFHTELQAVMDDFTRAHDYEFECDVLNGATDNGNLTVQGLKAQDLEAENQHTEQVVAELTEQTNDMIDQLQELSEQRERLVETVSSLKAEITTLEEQKRGLEAYTDKVRGTVEAMLLEFVNRPKIKPVWEKFVDQYQELLAKRAEERENRPSALDDWKSAIAREKQTSPVPDKPQIKKRTHERE